MSLIFYNIFLFLYRIGIAIASIFNPKAKLWRSGRHHLLKKITVDFLPNTSPVIWMHCASLGEFEQGRTVLESIKKDFPDHKIILTFFSPSGYEIRKNYENADWVYYMPLDSKTNAARFIAIIKPQLAIFVKYDYWYYYLQALHKNRIPTILISSIFREDNFLFKSYGGFQRKTISFLTHIFVQDAVSKQRLLKIIHASKITVAGDTRFDRVTEVAKNFQHLPTIQAFLKNKAFVIVAGSTWPQDEQLLIKYITLNNSNTSLIIAPHEVNSSHIDQIQSIFPNAVLYSDIKNTTVEIKNNVLIIDSIGLLSKLYYYADCCYIGGGFNKSGIHNTLEAAVYAKPVIFGPIYKKFAEAISLIENGGGLSFNNENQLFEIINNLKGNSTLRSKSGFIAGEFVVKNIGSTAIIMRYIHENLR